jgi:hypothetical protein
MRTSHHHHCLYIIVERHQSALFFGFCTAGSLSFSLAPSTVLLYTWEVFGVNCEAIPHQINFLTDEAGDWLA